MSVHALNNTGAVAESIGFCAQAVDENASRMLVLYVDENECICGHGFGPLTAQDMAWIGAFLASRSLDMTIDPEARA